jgi:hypothetical protein
MRSLKKPLPSGRGVVTNKTLGALRGMLLFLLVVFSGSLFCGVAEGQNPELQQRVAEVKEATVKNKQALAQYTWVEQVTISLKGEQKKVEHFQVRLGPDGKQQKTSLDAPPDTANDGGRLKRHICKEKRRVRRLCGPDEGLGSAVRPTRQGPSAAGLCLGKYHAGFRGRNV